MPPNIIKQETTTITIMTPVLILAYLKQLLSQPSLSFVLPSSHYYPGSITPFPHVEDCKIRI